MEVKKKYEELARKHSLPSFESINNDFELTSIKDETEFLLREIRRKISEKLESFTEILNCIVQPDTSVSDMHECSILDEEEREKAIALFKKLMFFERYSVEASINEDDKKTSKFISDFWKEWPNIKSEFLWVILKLKESWLRETDIKTDVGYLG